MAAFEQEVFNEDDDGYITESGGSDPAYDSDLDPSYSILEDPLANFSKLSIRKKSKSRFGKDLDVGVDENEEKVIENIIGVVAAGQLEKLKVEQCKVYLRKNGLRLSGNKQTLIQRIKEHLEISNGGGEKKYPVSSFVLGCKGDACTGEVVMFEQNVYEMFNIAARSAGGPPCGKRIVAGRIVKESYGAAKQQHTFTIEVLWSKGEKPLSPLHPLLIKGRNLYRLSTLRQRWEDEGERLKVLMEKHSRGLVARTNRETRIHGNEKRKMLKANRMSMNEDPRSYQSQMNSITAGKVEILPRQQPPLHIDSNKMKSGPLQPSVQPLQHSLSVDSRKPAAQPQLSADSQSQMNSFAAGKVKILPRQQPALRMDSNKMRSGPQQQPSVRPPQPRLSVDSRKPVAQPQFSADFQQTAAIIYQLSSIQPQQPSLSVDSRKLAAQLQFSADSQKAAAIQHQLLSDPAKLLLQSLEHKLAAAMLNNNSCQTQVPQNHVKLSSTSQVPNGPPSPNNRQPLKSVNQHHPTSPPQRQNCVKQQLCPYYPKGRCYFGDNCKFLHELRYKCDQRRDDRLHLGGHRQFERLPN